MIWWLGDCGHEWSATLNNRTKKNGKQEKNKCPYCANQKLLEGFNDLATRYPHLAKEWHPTKNFPLTPATVIGNNNNKVWWQCELGHEWKAIVNNRATKGTGCPICANKKIIFGFNDLATTHPELVKEWHPTKNEGLEPKTFVAGSNRPIWWKCSACEHEWKTSINERTQGKGCSVCAGQQVVAGINDLATTHPEIAKEWHPTKNGTKLPSHFVIGSRKKVWWKCEKGHEWETFIYNRKSYNSKSGTSCPFCQNDDSKGVKEIKLILERIKIPYICEQRFDDCCYKRQLPFDISLLDKYQKVVGIIEFDGKQHFEAVEFWGGEEALKSTQFRDQIKNNYCEQNNIPLLRIPYWEFEQIEELVTSFLKELKLLS